jgi:sacsin
MASRESALSQRNTRASPNVYLSFTTEQVAFSTPANAAPYLYAVPNSLACFATLLNHFSVRPTFGSSDFAAVLRRMAVETGAVVSGETGAAAVAARALSPSQLALALSLVQVLSDDRLRAKDLDVWVPDEDGVLAAAHELQYNDAPWLNHAQQQQQPQPPGGGGTAAAAAVSAAVRLVHPKISAGVGAQVGVQSLRQALAAAHAHDALDFGHGASQGLEAEAFGQSESITRRLRHILELYPEGARLALWSGPVDLFETQKDPPNVKS